ncbi:MAG: tol-pal system-associated acyl-CoA thioesterase [Pseudomonadota bacterium]
MSVTGEFRWPARVYYEDTDAQGVVYYANYLRYLERARSEWLRELGIDQPSLLRRDRMFVVSRVEIDYIVPARFDDALLITVVVAERRRASFKLQQRIVGAEADTPEHCRAEVTIAYLSASRLRPVKMPEGWFTES